MNKELKQANSDWDRPAIKIVLEYNKQYREENPEKYPYNDTIKDFILKKETIKDDLIEQLGHEIYLSQQDIRREQEQKRADNLKAEGYEELTEEVVKRCYKEKKSITVKSSITNDWCSNTIDDKFKCFWSDTVGAMLMKPRARSRGIRLSSFNKPFYKLT